MADIERTMDMVYGQAQDALEQSAKRADLQNPKDAEAIKDLLKIMHYAECIGSCEGGYSQAGAPYGGASYGSSYDGGSSYQRRDSMGRYSRTGGTMGGGYSGRRGYSRGSLMDHIDEMMSEARTDQERQAIERLKRDLER